MGKYILRRFLFSFFTLIGATAIVFGLSRAVGDPRDLFAQEGGYGVTEETYEHLTKMLNLDRPIYMQYLLWLGKTVRGYLGRSLLGQKDVSDLIGEKILNTWFQRNKIKEEEKIIRKRAEEVIDFLNLSHLTYELAGNLSGGQKKLLELGRTMMVDAKIVLLDEVGAGVNRTLLNDIANAIKKLNKEKGYTFCMIEHDIKFIGKLYDKVIVMAEGAVLVEGQIEEIKKNEKVIEAYLGRSGAV